MSFGQSESQCELLTSQYTFPSSSFSDAGAVLAVFLVFLGALGRLAVERSSESSTKLADRFLGIVSTVCVTEGIESESVLLSELKGDL